MALHVSIVIAISLLFCLSHGQSLPTSLRMRRSSITTTLSCREPCVADGKGQSLVQQKCDDGDFANLCQTGDCSCPTSTRKIQISCKRRACLSNRKRKNANVGFSNNNDNLVWILSYTVRGTIFDRKTKKPGTCKVVLEGEYRPRTAGINISKEKAQQVVDAALEAIFEVGVGKKVACVGPIKKAVQRATDQTLAMEDMTGTGTETDPEVATATST